MSYHVKVLTVMKAGVVYMKKKTTVDSFCFKGVVGFVLFIFCFCAFEFVVCVGREGGGMMSVLPVSITGYVNFRKMTVIHPQALNLI